MGRGKARKENIVRYSAKVDATTREEIERQADADDGPLPEGWEDTAVIGVPAPKARGRGAD
jgi:hypothetical protein